MRVLIVTNMYPTPAEPAFGSFVKEQVDDLRGLGLDVEEVMFDGRARSTEYACRSWGRLPERQRPTLRSGGEA